MQDPISSVTLLYNTMLDTDQGPFSQVAFDSVPETAEGLAYELGFEPIVGNTSYGLRIMGLTKYNSTASYLRLGTNGNVKVNTLYDKASWRLWEVTFTLFSRDSLRSECSLPRRCGSFGLCEEDQCVACPSPKGLLGWSSGPLQSWVLVMAGPREESSKCLLAPVSGTLTKVSNSSHVGFIKVSKSVLAQPKPARFTKPEACAIFSISSSFPSPTRSQPAQYFAIMEDFRFKSCGDGNMPPLSGLHDSDAVCPEDPYAQRD
ncbi:hypothetical protein MRB53_035855 [Persea americana]|uniref:Uncharacterized protein n=1 Tax=Persea americana TaxID=3435 RepID=A0ACC2K6E9_PERAE|nr:hypothetical protein MRB53_035855 [Persea americana]